MPDFTDGKYRSLRVFAGGFRFLGLLLVLAATIGGVFLIKEPHSFRQFAAAHLTPEAYDVAYWGALTAGLWGLLTGFFLYVTGEAITCFVDIEANTRVVAEAVTEEE